MHKYRGSTRYVDGSKSTIAVHTAPCTCMHIAVVDKTKTMITVIITISRVAIKNNSTRATMMVLESTWPENGIRTRIFPCRVDLNNVTNFSLFFGCTYIYICVCVIRVFGGVCYTGNLSCVLFSFSSTPAEWAHSISRDIG